MHAIGALRRQSLYPPELREQVVVRQPVKACDAIRWPGRLCQRVWQTARRPSTPKTRAGRSPHRTADSGPPCPGPPRGPIAQKLGSISIRGQRTEANRGDGNPEGAQVESVVQKRVLRDHLHPQAVPSGVKASSTSSMPQACRGTRRRRVGQGSGGFSVDASVRIEAEDRAGIERLVRYCARPPFALERLHALGSTPSLASPESRLIYRFPKPDIHGRTEVLLTPLELLDAIATNAPRRSPRSAPASASTPLPRCAGSGHPRGAWVATCCRCSVPPGTARSVVR